MPVFLSFLVCIGASCHVSIPSRVAFPGLAAFQRQGMMLAPSWEAVHVAAIRCTLGERPQTDDQA
ncbi:MAG: hypothetical protein ACRDNS_00960 [Trebonia sp.]